MIKNLGGDYVILGKNEAMKMLLSKYRLENKTKVKGPSAGVTS